MFSSASHCLLTGLLKTNDQIFMDNIDNDIVNMLQSLS